MSKPLKKLVLLGATGSIGATTLKIIDYHKDKLKLIGISGHQNIEKLSQIAHQFQVPHVAITDSHAYKKAKDAYLFSPTSTLLEGPRSLEVLATLAEADIIIVATVGTHGLLPTIAALNAKKTIALANKEVLVMAGEWIMPLAKKQSSALLPLDSEHNALFQCLKKADPSTIDHLILTASGGPFLRHDASALEKATLKSALRHPNWQMGPKVTIDSATLANKGLELIEAHFLFNVPEEKLKVVIHPQSIVHSLVTFIDGSTLGHFSPPNMVYAIQNSLFYPERFECPLKPLDFSQPLALNFEPPNFKQFPCLALAQSALKEKKAYPAIFNAANEIAVEAFIHNRIPFTKIPLIITKTLEKTWDTPSDLNHLLSIDQEARTYANIFLNTL
jgi:1-deoxy-D-xylulose-5-phosphate reductoisomerase